MYSAVSHISYDETEVFVNNYYAHPPTFSYIPIAFLPEYASPGAVKDSSLVSPEAMILNAPSIVGFLNGLMSIVDTGLGNCFGGFGLRAVSKFIKINCNDGPSNLIYNLFFSLGFRQLQWVQKKL